jgi:hypothetical protein
VSLFGNDDRGFDRVEVGAEPGEVKRLTRREFEALPLDQRVRAILSKQLRFYRGDREIPMREALGER